MTPSRVVAEAVCDGRGDRPKAQAAAMSRVDEAIDERAPPVIAHLVAVLALGDRDISEELVVRIHASTGTLPVAPIGLYPLTLMVGSPKSRPAVKPGGKVRGRCWKDRS